MEKDCKLVLSGESFFSDNYGQIITVWASETTDASDGGCTLLLNGTSLVILSSTGLTKLTIYPPREYQRK